MNPDEFSCGQKKRVKLGLVIYCSNACSSKSRRKTTDRICVFCGESFYIKPKKLEIGSGDFCSRKCFHAYQASNRIKKICPVCDTVFSVPPSLDRVIHCSTECRKRASEHNRIEKICKSCGKQFCVRPSSAYRQFCSKSCAYKSRKTLETGRKKRKDTLTPETRKKRKYKARPGRTTRVKNANGNTKVDRICRSCGVSFSVEPNRLKKGAYFCSPACKKLSKQTVESRFKKFRVEIIGEYVNTRTFSMFRCVPCGNIWKTNLNSLTAGHKCPECSVYGFQLNKPALMYYIRVSIPEGMTLYKIGVTNNTVQRRFGRQMRIMDVMHVEYFLLGSEAYAKEREILDKYSEYRYRGPRILRDGNHELFIKDILGLDAPLEITFTPCSLIQNPCLSLQVH